ncbi:hypothetical protein [uncultured Ruminococcus sp.]|uniref:hypothetical protein n=1 Tax=uncultured Ruminococcus sp. TaxID=165186 RepID=UPI0025E9EECA|nr:hypothetical protein [uncultured Ruminococcus sp.]
MNKKRIISAMLACVVSMGTAAAFSGCSNSSETAARAAAASPPKKPTAARQCWRC